MNQPQKKKKSHFQKMEFSDEQIREEIEDEIKKINNNNDINEVQKEQLILKSYQQRKQLKKKRKILQQDPIMPKSNIMKSYGVNEEDQQEGEVHQKIAQVQDNEQLPNEISINALYDRILPITLTRDKIQDLLNSPKFKQLVTRCFVRYLSDKQSSNSYMIAQVVGVTQGPKQYVLKNVKTKYLLKLQETSDTIVTLSIQLISNKHPPGGLQIEKWLRSNRHKILSDAQQKEKLQQHNKLLLQKLSATEIDKNILEKAKKIVRRQQEPKEDISYLIDFMNMKYHDIQMKMEQYLDCQDEKERAQLMRTNQNQKQQTEQIINKLKQISIEMKKALLEKKLKKSANQSNYQQKKINWHLEERKEDLINEKVKARTALLYSHQGYNIVKNTILEAHRNCQFTF